MSYVKQLACITCGQTFPADTPLFTCPSCGIEDGVLDVQYDYDAVARVMPPHEARASGLRSMWRYLPLLPIEQPALLPPLSVGWTPLYNSASLAGALGVKSLYIKDEGRNPTASFKDRASAVGVVKAKEAGATRIACASTGNAASSLAGFAAAAALPATIFVPERAPEAKVAQLLVYGAQVFSVEGSYDEAWELCQKASAAFGWYNRNCAVNPYLIEGKKTVSLELVEQIIEQYDGRFPDWIAVSVGDGCTIAGVWKGLVEMHILGFLPKLPKLLGVQADGCQPFCRAFATDGKLTPASADTLADSIAVGYPRNFQKALRAVRQSGGAFIAVTDQAILDALCYTARTAAVFSEPAGAACIAGVRAAVASGIIGQDAIAAVLSTGNGLKDTKSAILAAGEPTRIPPRLSAVSHREGAKTDV